MAQAGHTPDCVHCRFVVRLQSGEYRCRQHDITLHTPVSLLCKNLSPLHEDDEIYLDWFKQTLDTDTLENNTLYTWVTTTVKKQDTAELLVDVETVATITTYLNWSAGIFWQVLRDVRKDKREHYRRHGYQVNE
jgi:hypothetical protein